MCKHRHIFAFSLCQQNHYNRTNNKLHSIFLLLFILLQDCHGLIIRDIVPPVRHDVLNLSYGGSRISPVDYRRESPAALVGFAARLFLPGTQYPASAWSFGCPAISAPSTNSVGARQRLIAQCRCIRSPACRGYKHRPAAPSPSGHPNPGPIPPHGRLHRGMRPSWPFMLC